jgi:hypothetical protein
MRASDLLGKRVRFKDHEGQVVEGSDDSGMVIIRLDGSLSKLSPMVRVAEIHWELIEILDE